MSFPESERRAHERIKGHKASSGKSEKPWSRSVYSQSGNRESRKCIQGSLIRE